MKNSDENVSSEIILRWVNDTQYLTDVFSDSLNGYQLSMICHEKIEFVGDQDKIRFIYDVNRYGGRTLEDIERENNDTILSLSSLVFDNEPQRRISKIVTRNAQQKISRMESMKQLFDKYLKIK
jgi:hypothetical protein